MLQYPLADVLAPVSRVPFPHCAVSGAHAAAAAMPGAVLVMLGRTGLARAGFAATSGFAARPGHVLASAAHRVGGAAGLVDAIRTRAGCALAVPGATWFPHHVLAGGELANELKGDVAHLAVQARRCRADGAVAIDYDVCGTPFRGARGAVACLVGACLVAGKRDRASPPVVIRVLHLHRQEVNVALVQHGGALAVTLVDRGGGLVLRALVDVHGDMAVVPFGGSCDDLDATFGACVRACVASCVCVCVCVCVCACACAGGGSQG